MVADKNPYSRESKSNGRIPSILKRQNTCFIPEGTDGNTKRPRTPRRVSFAKTATVRYLHISFGDESCVSSDNSSDTFSASSGSSQSMCVPYPIPASFRYQTVSPVSHQEAPPVSHQTVSPVSHQAVPPVFSPAVPPDRDQKLPPVNQALLPVVDQAESLAVDQAGSPVVDQIELPTVTDTVLPILVNHGYIPATEPQAQGYSEPDSGSTSGDAELAMPVLAEVTRGDSFIEEAARPEYHSQTLSADFTHTNHDSGFGGAGVTLDPSKASYPQFSSAEARRQSFISWSQTHSHRPEDIVAAGFFYAGYTDCVRCFYCGLGLKGFRPFDSLAYHHAWNRPHCVYNILYSGQDYIDRVQYLQRQHSQLKVKQLYRDQIEKMCTASIARARSKEFKEFLTHEPDAADRQLPVGKSTQCGSHRHFYTRPSRTWKAKCFFSEHN